MEYADRIDALYDASRLVMVWLGEIKREFERWKGTLAEDKPTALAKFVDSFHWASKLTVAIGETLAKTRDEFDDLSHVYYANEVECQHALIFMYGEWLLRAYPHPIEDGSQYEGFFDCIDAYSFDEYKTIVRLNGERIRALHGHVGNAADVDRPVKTWQFMAPPRDSRFTHGPVSCNLEELRNCIVAGRSTDDRAIKNNNCKGDYWARMKLGDVIDVWFDDQKLRSEFNARLLASRNGSTKPH